MTVAAPMKTVFIHQHLQIGEQFGIVLSFVDDDSLRIFAQEGLCVGLHFVHHSGILQIGVGQFWEQLSTQSGLT